ncbi:hypothetical protein HK405_008750 [Cladochytrium tenue]|nr:hypothetical protein HK405_008750 [Cladochytrium tenue]
MLPPGTGDRAAPALSRLADGLIDRLESSQTAIDLHAAADGAYSADPSWRASTESPEPARGSSETIVQSDEIVTKLPSPRGAQYPPLPTGNNDDAEAHHDGEDAAAATAGSVRRMWGALTRTLLLARSLGRAVTGTAEPGPLIGADESQDAAAAAPSLPSPVAQTGRINRRLRRRSGWHPRWLPGPSSASSTLSDDGTTIPRHHHRSFSHKIKNKASEHWRDILRLDESVLPAVTVPTLALTAWAALVCVFYLVPGVDVLADRLPNSTTLVTVLGVVMSLLLVFRTNTSYDRFWEGRKTWSIVQSSLRNFARYTWVCVKPKNETDDMMKRGAMNLVVSFAIACKNYLRGSSRYRRTDLEPLVAHVPSFAAGRPGVTGGSAGNISIPLELTLHLQSFVDHCARNGLIDAPVQSNMTAAVSGLVDALTGLERIRSSPIPFAYSIHLKQTLLVYLLSLPFQIAPAVRWATVPAAAVAAFTMLGIEAIGGEIENPFGLDPNDLPMDDYADAVRAEIAAVVGGKLHFDSAAWLEPFADLASAPPKATTDAPPEEAQAQAQQKDGQGGESTADTAAAARPLSSLFGALAQKPWLMAKHTDT